VPQIFIDKKRDALLCPVYGMALPFHIKMVKNVAMMKGDTVCAPSPYPPPYP
jgi:nucleosome binding factor SPN SPT16 subunit